MPQALHSLVALALVCCLSSQSSVACPQHPLHGHSGGSAPRTNQSLLMLLLLKSTQEALPLVKHYSASVSPDVTSSFLRFILFICKRENLKQTP